MPKTFIVSVKAKHIKKGRPSRSTSCPVALALKEAGFRRVDVGELDMSVTQPKPGQYSRTLPNPRSVTRFVRNFDQHKKVKPFNFKLTLPS